MPKVNKGSIRVGVGGWTYEPWRGAFYPEGLVQKRELEYASRKLTSIEINGTFYGAQKPESFAKWHDETPDGFVFSLKGSRYTTNRRVLSDAGASIERFLNGGLSELKDKLGAINWQLAPTKVFDAKDVEGFLKLLPPRLGARPLRHAIEVRHASFRNADFVAMAREHGVAIVIAGDSAFPQIADPTAPFVYARIMGTTEEEVQGYSAAAQKLWVERAQGWAAGQAAPGLEMVDDGKADGTARDVYLYVISGFKKRNPLAAMSMIERL